MVHLTYAIGDIHGSYDLLRGALSAISRHARGRDHQIITLGDYIDRGHSAREVVDCLMNYRGAPLSSLRGNHEQMLVDCVNSASPRHYRAWLQHGGAQTLNSYGIRLDDPQALSKIPKDHINWMRRRATKIEGPHHIFVHAGIRPGISLVHQEEADFLWIRNEFVRAQPRQFKDARHIVHGHTPRWRGKPDPAVPEFLPHRTNLDTGAYMTGVLSVGVFPSDQRGGAVDLLSVM